MKLCFEIYLYDNQGHIYKYVQCINWKSHIFYSPSRTGAQVLVKHLSSYYVTTPTLFVFYSIGVINKSHIVLKKTNNSWRVCLDLAVKSILVRVIMAHLSCKLRNSETYVLHFPTPIFFFFLVKVMYILQLNYYDLYWQITGVNDFSIIESLFKIPTVKNFTHIRVIQL